ncbi:hypothetical protein BDV95DRAFT_482567 [Massariosphaeria phaeospora]|uniref:Uncharacterized protein n=1 Tax=Massariosphaeria phaeospora TaxID=100035 RepID=A0A7C8IEU8_9PLEO|nr:hypothetical protein BDV95DRAFT_482567 [Massariosphaeria phaeospora]
MSFGMSPSDIIKLVQFSTRIYVAFTGANEKSSAQVEELVREFSTFHHCLVELEDLMKEYGKPLPFPYVDFQETLQRCQKTLKPYETQLVDKRTNPKKIMRTILYMGKEKEMDGLRKAITGHYQALQLCISFLQLRLHLEATKQTQRLLASAPFRTMSFGGHMYTNNTSRAAPPNALPPPSEADQLYKEWLIFSRWLKSEDDRLAEDGNVLTRPISLGGTPATAPSDDESAAVLYRLRMEIEDAIVIEENRVKRQREQRMSLSPDDAMRREVQRMPQVPRTFTLDSEFSSFSNPSMTESTATIRPAPSNISPSVSPTGSPQIGPPSFSQTDWGNLENMRSNYFDRSPSVSTISTTLSTSAGSRSSISGLSIHTTETTPDMSTRPLRPRPSAASLATMLLGEGALEWTSICRKAQVERVTAKGPETKECDVYWRYREDTGLSLRSQYRSSSSLAANGKPEKKVWITQHFPATGPSIPRTTSYPDGDVSIDFPRSSFGHLEKRYTNIQYTLSSSESSRKLQTLLYTNNGKDGASLLYDKAVVTISSDQHKPECRGKNIRLWLKPETYEGLNGPVNVDVLCVLFYTSALPDEKAHWVEEPHYAFQWLDDAAYKSSSKKLELVFSKKPDKWSRDKLFQRRRSSNTTPTSPQDTALALKRTGAPDPGYALTRSGTASSVASSAMSTRSGRSSVFASGSSNAIGNMNRFGYSELKIEFQSKRDRADFLDIWKKYVKPLSPAANG